MSIAAFSAFILQPLLRYWAQKAKPQTQGTIFIPGLQEKVKVFWGPYGIPHLFAANEHDLFVAQGYIHAQERLWQMDLSRHFLSGRLSEIIGEKFIPWKELSIHARDKSTTDLDYFIRLIGTRRSACASLQLLPQEIIDRLLAYSEGVNHYIETHQKSLPVEFRLLRYRPEPWCPEDSLTIGKGFAFLLSTSLFTRLTMSAISDKLKGQETKLKSLFPTYPTGETTITRSASNSVHGILGFLSGTFQEINWTVAGQGSNNWVIAPWRSSTGKAILCNDPHLRLALPAFWYLMHLKASHPSNEADDFEVWGSSIPGSPYIQIGHNRWIAWGVTAAVCDDADLYREKIHPQESNRYLVNDQWEKMELIKEKIRIRGGKEINKTIRVTRHGPVISDFIRDGVATEALALKWTAHDPNKELCALHGTNRARNWNEFLDSLSHQVAPTLNYVYADTQGNIGYSLAGRVPIRPRPCSLLPLPGWDQDFDWQGYIPFKELPRIYNPPEGVIATANNRIADNSYPYHLSDLFDAPYRIQRIKGLLTSKERLSLEDMAQFQNDTVSIQGKEIIGLLKADFEKSTDNDTSLKESVDRLIRWDGSCSEKSPEAALFHLFYHRLKTNLLTPDLGQELYFAYNEIFNQSLTPIDQILQDPRSEWFAACSRQALVEKSLRETREELVTVFGTDIDQWSWGKIHTLTLRHPMDRSKILASLFSIGPFSSPGDGVTINMGFYRHSNPFRQVVGPSLRMIIDLGDWNRSRFVLPSGQSGHLFSPHYRDQTELWRTGNYIRLSYEEKKMKEWPLLKLTPFRDH